MPYKDPEKKREQNRESVRKYRQKNLERCREIGRDWARNNAERHRANAKRWREENWEKREAYALQNLDTHRARVAAWARRNPERLRLAALRRRAVKASAPGAGLTRRDWDTIREYHCGLCAYCLTPCAELTVDHVIALTQGGAHDPDNIVPACGSCNSSKGPRTLIGWVLRKGAP